jgi:O-antigen ligase
VTSRKFRFSAAHLAWTAMFCSIFIWGLGDVRSGTLGNTGNWYRIVLVAFAGIAGLYALLRNTKRLTQAFSGPLVLLLLYGLFAVISSAYIPAYAFYSMWKGFEVVIDVIAVAAVLSYAEVQGSARMAYTIVVTLFGTLMAVYWVEALLMPSAAFLPSRGLIPVTMQGVLPVMNGNGFAFLSAVVAFAAWCGLFKVKKLFGRACLLSVFVWAVITLFLAQSRTSLVGLALAICVYLFFDRRWVLLALIVIGVTLVAALTSFTVVAEQYVIRGQSQQLFSSLSGRTQAWEAAWKLFQESPVVGNGFAAAARVEILGTASTAASTLHGSIFDVMVGVGLLGLIPWVVAIVWTSVRLLSLTGRRARRRNETIDRSAVAEMLGVLALVLVRSSTSSGLAMHDHTFMLFLTVLAFTSAASRRRLRGPAVTSSGRHSAATHADATPHAAV